MYVNYVYVCKRVLCVCVYVCMYMYVYIYVYMYVHMYVSIHVCVSVFENLIGPISFLFGTAQFSLWARYHS